MMLETVDKTYARSSQPQDGPGIPAFDLPRIRADFPVLAKQVHGHPLVYLDNAATTQKPQPVLEALKTFYGEEYATIQRGVYHLAEEATNAFEKARGKVKKFLGASSEEEIVFTRGATEAINLVAHSFGEIQVEAGDEIVISEMEHHSNIVPWQLLCERKGAKLRVIPFDETGTLDMTAYGALLGPRTKLVAVVHISNVLGTINPVKQMVQMAHERGIPVLVDGAQSVQHTSVDVQDLDCDFFVFSGHKVFGPMGIGVLYGKKQYLNKMPPYQGGGGMIATVTFEKTQYAPPPARFEAGTLHVAGAIGLGAALDYVTGIGRDAIEAHNDALLAYGLKALRSVSDLRIIGMAEHRASILSFVVGNIHPHDLGTILDSRGIAVRVGHHCAQPVMDHFNVPATARASLAMYNTKEEIDALVLGLKRAKEMFEACPISTNYTKKLF